jgi:hypothetical protein
MRRLLKIQCSGQREFDLSDALVVRALAVNLPSVGDGDVIEMQYMPPGKGQKITARRGDGKVVELVLDVNEKTAGRLGADLERMLARAAKNEDDRPYLDFNHEDREASGWPKRIWWGGEDPISGGVRMEVELSAAGKAAIAGKLFRRFSPSFFARDGEVLGTERNMGGFVNRAAFKRISPMWAKEGAEADPAGAGQAGDALQNKKKEATEMKLLMQVLARLGLVSSADLEESAAIAQVTAKHEEGQAKLSAAIAAKDTAEAENTTLKGKLTESQKANAKAIVARAVAEGKLPAQAKEVHQKWEDQISADPKAADLLEAMEAKGAPERVVERKAGEAGGGGGSNGEHAFVVKCKDTAKALGKADWLDAVPVVAAQDPKLYDEYSLAQNGGAK